MAEESHDVTTSIFYDTAVCIAMDLFVFVAFDYISKEAIRGARSAADRRRVWLYESLSLVLASCVIAYVHHRPWLLLLFALPTLVFAVLHGRSDFSRATEAVRLRWNEFKEHHESLEALRQLERSRCGGGSSSSSSYANNVSPAQQAEFMRVPAAPAIVIDPQNTRPGLSPAGQLRSLRFNEQKAVYEFVGVRGSSASTGERQPTVGNVGTAAGSAISTATASGSNVATVIRRAASDAPSTAAASDAAIADAAYGLLRRRPIRTESAESSEQKRNGSRATSLDELGAGASMDVMAAAQRPSAAWAWGAKVLSALGLGRAACAGSAPGGGDGTGGSGLPPGLRNPGSLCFVNASLQCLARSPDLADSLAEESKGAVAPDARPTELALLDVCAEVMQKINVHPAENDCAVLDHSQELREAAAELNADLFAVDKPQQQQDAAEFLTWLLSELHDVINESNLKGAKKVLRKGYLQQLRVIYGDISARQCEQLKAACRQEIAAADGLNMSTYAEAIQRLSDIEWLSYKHRNYSVIDDLFTGQMVETRVCTRCSALAVSIQPFNLLSVPLPEVASAPTTLEDCLRAYGTVEIMRGGAGGARCDVCVRRIAGGLVAAGSRSAVSATPPRSVIPTANAAALLSPIASGSPCAGDDSGLQVGGNFLTSTPAAQLPGGGSGRARANDDAAAIVGSSMQRRCLLRQLPDCIVLQLMRFQYDAALQQSRKVKSSVVLPLEGLDLSHIVYDAVTCRLDLTSSSESERVGGGGTSENLSRYSLYGLCLHVGAESTSCGHYVSYARAVDGQWYVFDDEMVLRVTNMAAELQTKSVRENCYLLFYRRQTGTSD